MVGISGFASREYLLFHKKCQGQVLTASLIVISLFLLLISFLEITEKDLSASLSPLTCPYCVFTMNHSGAAVEVTKDRNGIDQVVLRNPRGASARVRIFLFYFSFSFSSLFIV